MIEGRLIHYSEHDGAMNMAIDQALLSSVGRGGPPTLRWYGWSEPTLSLGYFQSFSDVPDSTISIVRRSTGGGAIVHHHELTIALTLPTGENELGSHQEIYQGVHAAIIQQMRALGIQLTPHREIALGKPNVATVVPEPFLCFQRRTDEDLILAGYKVLGSAQRRVRGGLLQHGSLLLRVSPHAVVLPGIENLAGQTIDPQSWMTQMTAILSEHFQIRWRPGSLTSDELREANQSYQERYASAQWTRRR